MTVTRLKLAGHALQGEVTIPGDKSISHRSFILASHGQGETRIKGLLTSADVMATATAIGKWGIKIEKQGEDWLVQGKGLGGLTASSDVIDCGNSGTSARLLMGLAAAYDFTSFFTGDASLRKRPMKRVVTPLSEMGAKFTASENNTFPLAITGGKLNAIEYTLPIASAQVKSAILLAGLNTKGTTTVIEPTPSRDHTEKMFNFFDWKCETQETPDGGRKITFEGQQETTKKNREIIVPGDPSSAAFPMVAALITKGSEVTLKNIGMNPLRTGLFTTLQEMGAELHIHNERDAGGEQVVDITVKGSQLNAIDVPANRAPSMIDEYPILCIAAAFAKGTSRFRGLHELRVKESDRLTTMHQGLTACGVKAEIEGDDLIITGGTVQGGATIDSQHDHRIAMSFLIMGLQSENRIKVSGIDTIATSFPNFFELMESLGATQPPKPADIVSTLPSQRLVIAIDGPAASGKGTLARRLANELGLKYLDTGSLYRAVGMKLVYAGLKPEDAPAALHAANNIELQDLRNPRLRQEHVGRAASIVSAMPEVRASLLDFQRKVAADDRGAVLDGRDIGTVVCPEADFKFFVTANVETRAARRHRELSGQGITVIFESVLEDLVERDERDSKRKAAPLKAADDATQLDTSTLDADGVFAQVLDIIEQKLAA
ncbi:MAG: 3-phosphoshikimate 1-carboxyvinyltransferase [Rickettsiales bacterium]|nr:3-phosphoshikimate 1-carboxyvinyltransferase [Rickettsiales bacterium]